MNTVELNEQTKIPVLGFGTWQLEGEECVQAVSTALEVGYRHIDTADVYGNHKEVARAIKESGIPREELFVTTKIPRDLLRARDVSDSCERYLKELNMPYVDLFLIHWPNRQIPIAETLEAMNQLKKEEKVKAIGVSNFTEHHLEDALSTGYEVTLNQVELHPTFNQLKLQEFCKSKNVAMTAYSPLGRGEDLSHPTILESAKKYGVSPAQVVLNWIISRGIVAIPKSSNPDRIEDNFKATSWEMEKEDLEMINGIPQQPRILDHPSSEFNY
ncbi:MAG: aldo/keto reductase [Candidatus Blackburnbacteria bacterium]|nr:aldo/keto reductase [Candidatus Blackburnbacteria bacterium]